MKEKLKEKFNNLEKYKVNFAKVLSIFRENKQKL